MGKYIEMINKKFNSWTVIKKGSYSTDGHIKYTCQCDCGTIKDILGKTLRSGESKGCRKCMPKRMISNSPLAYRHGLSHSPTYKVWGGIIARCHNPKDTGYKWYGAKDIKVCESWRKDFLNFYNDMGERPIGCSIDRIDVYGNYTKENCKWSTVKEQNLNKTNTTKINNIYFTWKILEVYMETYKSKAICNNCNRIVIRANNALKNKKLICLCQRPGTRNYPGYKKTNL